MDSVVNTLMEKKVVKKQIFGGDWLFVRRRL